MNKIDFVNFFTTHTLEGQKQLELNLQNIQLKQQRRSNALLVTHEFDKIESHRLERLLVLQIILRQSQQVRHRF